MRTDQHYGGDDRPRRNDGPRVSYQFSSAAHSITLSRHTKIVASIASLDHYLNRGAHRTFYDVRF